MSCVPSDPRRLRAPRENHAALVAPARNVWDDALAANVARRRASTYDVQGQSLADLSLLARDELLTAARRWTAAYRDAPAVDPAAPLILAGHQPQIVHPGVWLKNFVLAKFAARSGATAVNLVVDGDTLAAPTLRVPDDSPASPRIAHIAYDSAEPGVPYEERTVTDDAAFAAFGVRVAERLRPFVPEPLVQEYWPLVMARRRHTDNLGACLAQARHQLEAQWGLHTLEVPQSRVCASMAFRWFAAHLLAQLPRFREVYNAAVHEYRRTHRLRSVSHPAPDLTVADSWLETPFWVWTAADPQRRRLFARHVGRETMLTDRHTWEARLPLSPARPAADAATALQELERRGVKIRSRALLTTLWARLALGDLFIHGIGGAKYDEVTDLIIARFFGLEPPTLAVVTGTLHLPWPHTVETPADPQALQQKLRALTYHPERFLDGEASAPQEVIVAKQRWIATPQTRANARQRCRAIRQANEALQPFVAEQRRQLGARIDEAQRQREIAQIRTWREYGFCLYPAALLREFLVQPL